MFLKITIKWMNVRVCVDIGSTQCIDSEFLYHRLNEMWNKLKKKDIYLANGYKKTWFRKLKSS